MSSPNKVLDIPDRLKPFRDDVFEGLSKPQKELACKYFYDQRGSELFNFICELDEYYPTRTEDALLSRFGMDIISEARPARIIELGCGTCRKTRHLLDACENQTQVCEFSPFDVCIEIVSQVTIELQEDYRWLDVIPLVGDYHAGLGNLPDADGVTLIVFLGSTIGNFTPGEAHDFIEEIRCCMRPGDYFLLGADRVKDEKILNAAYNDAQGLTASFNLNVLEVINREINADFKMEKFSHQARFNRDLNRIEMYLISEMEQEVYFRELDSSISLNEGEGILTEISRKFTYQELESMLVRSGFDISRHFEPDNKYFSLILSRLT